MENPKGIPIQLIFPVQPFLWNPLRAFWRQGALPQDFFPDGYDNRSYLDPINPFYAPKLAAAVMAWEKVSSDENLLSGKTPKQEIEKWQSGVLMNGRKWFILKIRRCFGRNRDPNKRLE